MDVALKKNKPACQKNANLKNGTKICEKSWKILGKIPAVDFFFKDF